MPTDHEESVIIELTKPQVTTLVGLLWNSVKETRKVDELNLETIRLMGRLIMATRQKLPPKVADPRGQAAKTAAQGGR